MRKVQQSQEAQIRIIAAGHAQLAAQLGDITVAQRRQDGMLDEHSKSLRDIARSVDENTGLTRDIKEAVETGRALKKLVIWGSGAAIVVAQWWDQIKAALHK